MTFEEWYKKNVAKYLEPQTNDYAIRQAAEEAWSAAKADVKKRLENHDMATMYDEVISEDNEEGFTLEGEIKKIIGD